MLDSLLQWSGTSALLLMYVLMSFYPELYPWNLVAGLAGGICYLGWSLRTSNRAQQLVNAAGIMVCVAGLVRVWG